MSYTLSHVNYSVCNEPRTLVGPYITSICDITPVEWCVTYLLPSISTYPLSTPIEQTYPLPYLDRLTTSLTYTISHQCPPGTCTIVMTSQLTVS
jgi:hypothetical protein